jgi:hypothetical protein
MAVLMSASAMLPNAMILLFRPRAFPEHGLKCGQGVGLQRRVPSALHSKSERPIQPRDLVLPEPLCLSLAQPDPNHRLASLYLIVQRDGITANVQTAGKCLELLASRRFDELVGIKNDASSLKVVPAGDRLQLLPDHVATALWCKRWHAPARSAPELIQLGQGSA